MRAGELDRRITIESRTESRSTTGAATYTWATLATVWAKVKPVRGQEYFAASQVNAQVDAIFTIRYRADITRTMRISYGGEYYDIQDIAELGRGEGLELYARVQQA